MLVLRLAAEEVLRKLGPGHTESTYHRALETELSSRGISFSSEGTIPILYKGSPVGRRRPDMFLNRDDGTVIVELKAGGNSGEKQIASYNDILSDDENFDIVGAYLVRFGDELEIIEA